MGKNYCLSFLEEAEKSRVVLQCIFGRDFLSPRATIVLGIETDPVSCCSDDLALLLLPCLNL